MEKCYELLCQYLVDIWVVAGRRVANCEDQREWLMGVWTPRQDYSAIAPVPRVPRVPVPRKAKQECYKSNNKSASDKWDRDKTSLCSAVVLSQKSIVETDRQQCPGRQGASLGGFHPIRKKGCYVAFRPKYFWNCAQCLGNF